MNIRLKNVNYDRLEFNWDPVAILCPAIQYSIEATNCGRCPNITTLTNATCIGLNITNEQTCVFSISTVVCSDVFGTKNSFEVLLSGISTIIDRLSIIMIKILNYAWI